MPVGSAASKIAVRVLDHPVGQVRNQFLVLVAAPGIAGDGNRAGEGLSV